MSAIVKDRTEKVRVKYIPTGGGYRGMKLQCSLQSRDMKRESVSLKPNEWKLVSWPMVEHLKRKQRLKKEGVRVPDGSDLEGRMASHSQTMEQTRNEEIFDFELIVEGE